MDYENFEGIKKIENIKSVKIEELYEILKRYQEMTGEVKYLSYKDDLKIVVDVDGKYYVDIFIEGKNIVIERKLEYGNEENISNSKDLSLVQADRMIEQIYDLIKEYLQKGTITEHITKAKSVLYAKQISKKALGARISLGDVFEIRNEAGEVLYQVKKKPLSKTFSLYNLKQKREEAIIDYTEEKDSKFSILKHPFENIVIKKDSTSEKTKFVSEFSTKKLKISGDYTDNHYMVELNEIVIGAVDSLDPETKQEYRLEINDFEFAYIVICFSVIADLYWDLNLLEK